MICQPCRRRAHTLCPEYARQLNDRLTPIERAGSHQCACQHWGYLMYPNRADGPQTARDWPEPERYVVDMTVKAPERSTR